MIQEKKQYTVDVLIPVYKPNQQFKKTLKRLDAQTRKPDRIILMNTEEQFFDKTVIERISYAEVHHIKKSQFDHGGTRNQAVCMSNADIVICMTQDAIPANEHVIEELIKPFQDQEVAAVYARQMADAKKSPIEAYTRMFNYPEQSRKKTKEDIEELGIKTFFCSNVCAAYRRCEYDAVGGFIKKTIFNEDMILASQLIERGKAIYYNANAKVWHWHDYSGMEQLHRNFDLAVSQQSYGGIFFTVKSEGEGVRLVLATMKHLQMTHKSTLIPKLIWQSGCKYIGYKLGRMYEKLPKWLVLKLTMNQGYWKD